MSEWRSIEDLPHDGSQILVRCFASGILKWKPLQPDAHRQEMEIFSVVGVEDFDDGGSRMVGSKAFRERVDAEAYVRELEAGPIHSRVTYEIIEMDLID